MDTTIQAPLILSFETSGETGGVALYRERLLGEIVLSGAETYSRRLLPAVDFLLEHLGLSLSEVSVLAVSIGPGSFTGLRIGLATVKGLALALKKPVVAVESLAALAALFPESSCPLCPVLDARRGEVYAALYRFKAQDLETLMPPSVLSPDVLCERIESPTIFLGEGLRVYGNFFQEKLGPKFIPAPGHLREARASSVAYLAERKVKAGEFADPETLVPLYLRPSEAERKKGLKNV